MSVWCHKEPHAPSKDWLYSIHLVGAAERNSTVSKRQRVLGLWLGRQVWFAGVEIDRHGDMFVNDKPIALKLTINVGDSNGEVNRLAHSVGACETLNAMAETHCSTSSDAQVTNFELQWSVDHAKYVCPVFGVGLGTNILTWWEHVEHEKTFRQERRPS
jgi:hypothetical protein